MSGCLGRGLKKAREQQTVVLRLVDIRLGTRRHTRQAIEKRIIVGDRAGKIEHAISAAIGSRPDDDFMEGRVRGTLAHHVDDAARVILAVEDGGRPLQDLHTLKKVRIDLGRAAEIADVGQIGAFEIERRRRKTTDLDIVECAGGRAAATDVNASRVIHGLLDGFRTTRLDLVGGDHGNRLRHFNQRGVGFRAGCRPAGDCTGDRPPGTFLALDLDLDLDLDRFEHGRITRVNRTGDALDCADQCCGSRRADLDADACSDDQAVQGATRGRAPLNSAGLLASDQGGGLADLPAALANEGIQRRSQRLQRYVEGNRLQCGRGGLALRHRRCLDAQGRGAENGGRQQHLNGFVRAAACARSRSA